ncbi:MAG: hypothetical protein COB34_04660 [Methylophilaceae bacterium]|nr:MAG: hypothetical protein COB34_04660 [Methylophilaceae bacterium]
MKNNLIKSIILMGLLLMTNIGFAADMGVEINATTVDGDKVILKPNGRWEYIDTQKASEAAKVAKQYPENQGCPPGSQGGSFGTKCILPGDKAFNRKSRIGK